MYQPWHDLLPYHEFSLRFSKCLRATSEGAGAPVCPGRRLRCQTVNKRTVGLCNPVGELTQTGLV